MNLVIMSLYRQMKGVMPFWSMVLSDDIGEIGRMIGDLDQPLPLARIDTIFLMVDLSDTSSSGIDALFKDLKYDEEREKFLNTSIKMIQLLVCLLVQGREGKFTPLHLMEHFKSRDKFTSQVQSIQLASQMGSIGPQFSHKQLLVMMLEYFLLPR